MIYILQLLFICGYITFMGNYKSLTVI